MSRSRLVGVGMLTLQKVFLVCLAFGPCAFAEAAIFGHDDRSLISEKSPYNELARSTAIAILSSNFTQNPSGTITLNPERLGQFCSDEPLYNEPSLTQSCTGFLVAPDLLVTAGHCVFAVNNPGNELKNEPGLACEAFDWLFDYETTSDGRTQVADIPADRFYHCKQIVYAVQHEGPPFDDYALIQLDRPVPDRMSLTMSRGTPAVGSSTYMIGHPFGTPNKLTSNGKVILNNPQRTTYITTLDAFEGNSGSPVFDSKNEVVGILVAGTPMENTYTDKKLQCERPNRCRDDGTVCVLPDTDYTFFPGFQTVGSEVQRIQPIIDVIKSHLARFNARAAGTSEAPRTPTSQK